MKLFEQLEVKEPKEPEAYVTDSSVFVKRNLVKGLTRSDKVNKAIEEWLFSWEGGITKKLFEAQVKRLDWDDDIAISQLNKASGKRSIPLPPPPKKPLLQKPLIEQMVDDRYVAIYGRNFKSAIKQAVKELKVYGTVYVLQVEELILQFSDYEHKGKSPQMIENAIDCDFLVIVDLEMPIHIEWHIHEAISRIGRMREAAKKPIISTWCRFNDCNDFFERFKVYEVR